TLRPSHVSVPHQGVYVLELADLGQSIAVAYSSPHSALGLVDKGTLRETAALAGHTGAVSALAVLPAGQLLSASADASVLQWDPRARRPAATLSQGGHKRPAPLLSVAGSGDGVLVAAGSELTGDDAVIYFWDLRKAETPMYSHSSTHSDDIPTLSFHPSQPHLLLSASTDGLLSLTNALEADEDEAVVEVANWGVSVAKAGWAGEGGGRVWARSDMETVSLWDAELSLVHDFGDARRAAVAGGWATDYVVQCDFRGDDLQILAGSNDGSFSHICAPSTDRWALERTYAGGHSAIVRSVLFDRAALRVFSGGEDGALAAW
ncbi:WD40 repeat-like protein, partial [Calocera cornea HHB12733]